MSRSGTRRAGCRELANGGRDRRQCRAVGSAGVVAGADQSIRRRCEHGARWGIVDDIMSDAIFCAVVGAFGLANARVSGPMQLRHDQQHGGILCHRARRQFRDGVTLIARPAVALVPAWGEARSSVATVSAAHDRGARRTRPARALSSAERTSRMGHNSTSGNRTVMPHLRQLVPPSYLAPLVNSSTRSGSKSVAAR